MDLSQVTVRDGVKTVSRNSRRCIFSPQRSPKMASALMNLHRGLCPRFSLFSTIFVTARRTFVSTDAPPRVPPPRDPSLFQLGPGPSARPAENIPTAKKFLESIGRGMAEKVDQNMSWEELWKLDGQALRKAGLAVRDRRYALLLTFAGIYYLLAAWV